MKDLIDRFTWSAIGHHDDGVVTEFYRSLREDGRLRTTRCTACGYVGLPPRPLCPSCFADRPAWVEIGPEGTLYAFTTQARAFRFMAPDVIGIVEIAGVGRLLTKIEAPLDSLRIGQRVRFEPLVVSDLLTTHAFRPID